MNLNIEKVNVFEKSKLFSEIWNPKIIGELNGQHVKIVHLEGTFGWHSHENEDEMFYVLSGEIEIEFRSSSVILKENEFLIIPKGVEHNPSSKSRSTVLLFEPIGTLNTGNTITQKTQSKLDKI